MAYITFHVVDGFHYLVNCERMIVKTHRDKTHSISFFGPQTTATSSPIHFCHKAYYARTYRHCQASGLEPSFRMTRGSFFVTLGGSASVIDLDDGNASATSSVGWLLFGFFRSGDVVGLVEVPWLFNLRALSDMELGGMNALRLDDDSALRGSRMASKFEVRSNHGGGVSSLVPRADIGPRRFLASFSSCTHRPSVLSPMYTSPKLLPSERFQGTTSAPSSHLSQKHTPHSQDQ